MKKILLFLLLFCGLIVKSQTPGAAFTLTGKIAGQNSGKLKLYYTGQDGKRRSDSCLITGGSFVFKGFLAEPCMAYLDGTTKSDNMDDLNTTRFFIEPGSMNISLTANDYKNAVITGSKVQDEFAGLEKSYAPIIKETEPLELSYTKSANEYRKAIKDKLSEATLDSMKEKLSDMHDQFEPYQQRIANLNFQFFASHPDSYITANELRQYAGTLSLDSLEMFYNNMSAGLKQSLPGKEIYQEIEKLRSGSPGSVAKDFTAMDINGKNLSLSQFKGKYILIDFWASWCVPCRHSSPHILALYKKYHGEGLEIIGVADDDSKPEEWKKAVAKDSVGVWHHVLRGIDWDKINSGQPNPKDISEKFGIHSLPTKILINKNGVIVGRYDKGTDEEAIAMDRKIAEVFGN